MTSTPSWPSTCNCWTASTSSSHRPSSGGWDTLAARIAAGGGTALAVPLDVTDREAVRTAAGQVCEQLVPQLIGTAGAGRPADLITTSSIAATRVLAKFSVYSGTKAYISQLTRLLRVELCRKMVRVATIEFGMVDTELPDHVTDPDASRLMADLINDIDVLQPADVAKPSPSSRRCPGT